MNSARPGDGDLHLPRRIRHITSIQIRNLTPYPVRDTFASALTQPSQQPQFTPLGGFSDDLDVTVGRRRGRRISSASTTSARNAVPDREGSPSEPRRRFNSIGAKPTSPRTTESLPGLGKPSTSPAQKKAPNVSPSGVGRPALRQRTSSTTSLFAGSSGALPEEASATSMILPNFLRDTSQRGLENILRSRLVETYITLTVLPSETTPPDAEMRSGKSSSASSSARALNTFTHRPTASVSSVASGSRFRAHQKTMSISNESATSVKPSANTSHRQDAPERGASPKSSTIRKDPETPELVTPDFYSEVHKASTNPSFIIDPQRHLSTAKNLSGSRLRVEVWARSDHGHEPPQSGQNEKGKGRATGIGSFDANGHGWKVLESWDVDLNELIPLPDDFASHPTYLPANTLFITLSPPDKTFYLPQYSLFHVSRSPSPSTGYISDPELDVRRNDSRPSSPAGLNVIAPVKSPDSVSPGSAWTSFKKEATRRTVGWQDLLKLVTLQKCIQDTKSSLEDVVHDIDHLVTHDTVGILNREVSERRAQVRQLEVEKTVVLDESQNLKAIIDMKKEELRLRREALAEARRTLQEGITEEETRERELLDERTELVALRNRLPVLRSSLISIVSFIYPIELVSPPDLLFSILDVPLPIPVAPTDPAPPLNVTGISEDVVATALGYAAQVVQLLASYLNVHLTYPVTCIGSRSLIKDGISAMVGPRMFPLFSRGVDTYRFEYGVFLLNKDIELLMSERDLRALDMRHTLPNLKNLLLTLTDADAPSQRSRPLPKANSEMDGLRSPIPSSSSLSSEPTVVEEPIEGNLSKAANNAKTSDGRVEVAPVSTQSSTVTRKSRAFLRVPPLSGFLRVRYPSSSSRTEAESESLPVQDQTASSHTSAEVANGLQNGKTSDDESDRRTIRGVAPDQEPAAAEEKDSVSQTQRIPLVSR